MMSDLPLWLQIVGGLCAFSFVVRKMGPALVRGGGQRRCDRKTARSEAPRQRPAERRNSRDFMPLTLRRAKRGSRRG